MAAIDEAMIEEYKLWRRSFWTTAAAMLIGR